MGKKMRILAWIVFALALLTIESLVFTGGVVYGDHKGYRAGYLGGITTAKRDESDAQLKFVLDRMAFYESSYNVDARGDFDGTRYLAYGLYQFHHRTFTSFSRLSGNIGLDWKNPEHQLIVATWAIKHGYGYKLWGRTYRRALHDYFMNRQGRN